MSMLLLLVLLLSLIGCCCDLSFVMTVVEVVVVPYGRCILASWLTVKAIVAELPLEREGGRERECVQELAKQSPAAAQT